MRPGTYRPPLPGILEKRSLFLGARQSHFWKTFHNVPTLVKWSPFIMMAIRLRHCLVVLYPGARACRVSSPVNTTVLYKFLLNKWYFDELYDFLFVRPAKRMWLGSSFWKQGDGRVIDGFGPNGVSARVLDVTKNVS